MSDAFFSTLNNFLNSLSYSKGKISSDNSLNTNLVEFQKYKRLSVKDGSLNAETFQALGEKLSPVQIEILTLHQPRLKHLFQGRPRNGFLYKPTLQPETIILDLNIVYEQNRFTEPQARKTIKENLSDLKDVFSQIKIEFNVVLTPGTGTDYDKATGFYNKIATGAKEGIINMFLYRK